ncbi:MAG: nitronate monooxygenase [Oscillospiraceae bacterium]|nr:nitronate monooxygenase [Oscillospiraceae bacterium]
MEIKTRVTEMLGIKYPIIQGCMQWFATADLAAAVSNAGGLGVISSATFKTAEDLRQEIRRCKELTDKPFAVNLSLFPSLNPVGYTEHIKVAAEEGVKIIETAGRAPTEYMEQLKAANMTVIHKCVAVKHALKAQSIGCDMVVIDGYEAAGHIGEFDTATMVLTPRAVDALDIPVITAGGVCDGRTMAAALMLGAEGVYMGSRFFASQECPATAEVKQALVENYAELDTYIGLRPYRNSTRFVKNELMQKVVELEKAHEPFETVAPLVAGFRTRGFVEGDRDFQDGSLCIGECLGNIHDVPTCAEIIERTIDGCIKQLNRFN